MHLIGGAPVLCKGHGLAGDVRCAALQGVAAIPPEVRQIVLSKLEPDWWSKLQAWCFRLKPQCTEDASKVLAELEPKHGQQVPRFPSVDHVACNQSRPETIMRDIIASFSKSAAHACTI